MENNSYSSKRAIDPFNWEEALHMVQFLNLIIPAGGLIGAFAIWKMKGKDSQRISAQGVEVLNFQVAVVLITTALGLFRLAAFFAVSPELSDVVISVLMCIAIGAQIYFPGKAVTRIKEGKEPSYPVIHRFFN